MASDLLHAPKEFLRLFQEGKVAARAGQKKQAHALFRQAIEIDPYHEQVWLWLASVVDSDEDRRVCFENVLELNPSNPTARRQLQKMEQAALEAAMGAKRKPPKKWSRKRTCFFRVEMILLIVLASLIAAWALGAF